MGFRASWVWSCSRRFEGVLSRMAMRRGALAPGLIRALTRPRPVGSSAESSVFCRGFAKAAKVEEEDIVKNKFVEKIKQFYTLLSELKNVKIVVDPDDPKAVKDFAQNIKAVRQKVGLPHPGEHLQGMMLSMAKKSKTVREYYHRLDRFQAEHGVDDVLGVNKLMFEAIDKVENKIGKPLTGTDKQGMEMFRAESDAVLKKLGINESDLSKYEEEADLEIAKGHLQDMKDKAIETMETYKRRDGLQDVNVDVKELEPRNFLAT